MLYDQLRNINPVTGTLWSGVRAAGWIEPNRVILNHELVYFASGSARVITARGTLECRTGSLIILPPNLQHCTVAGDSETERYCIHFDWEPAEEIPGEPFVYTKDGEEDNVAASYNPTPGWMSLPLPAHRIVADPQACQKLIDHIFRFPDRDPRHEFKRKGFFTELLAYFFDEENAGPATTPHSRSLLIAKGYIDTHFRNNSLNIQQVAGNCAITENHLCKIFRAEMGFTPLEYLHQKRLGYAKMLLRTSSMSITEIARKAGFGSANYFARIFRQKQGLTPSKYATKT